MSTSLSRILALQCSMLAAIAGCGGPSGAQSCTHDDDCPSDFCLANGTCSTAGTDGSMPTIDAPAGSNVDGSTGACTPNHDGTISANEIPLAAGQSAHYRIATNVTQSTAGTTGSDGSRTWDLSGQLAGDMDTTLALTAPTGQWWASKFTSATYSTPLAAGSDVLGIFEITPTAVELLGIVSPASGGPTDLKYSPPATILKIPFKAGDAWSSSSTVSGTLDDIISNYTETYDSTVDAVGTMTTPYGAFPVLRVATNLTDLQLGTAFNANKTFAWEAECFGTVAKITSGSNESGEEFSADAEVDRLAP